ncbi:spermatogenesis-associated protein 4 isoform X3 [Sphaerodactylus townsendi]|uniref:spermatogenesis-associated protein 4 isoform X3 n=1 Tax=Sphaerodactylus townsendi TaxID=933632 RepID=UPI002025E00D|nr:spermatogenesis-associated protein 4 isoform X3 [Sphaerodactylus townsendi]
MSDFSSTRRTGLPRAVLRWLQSLDLTVSPRPFRRDFSNGYLIAEIFSWYYPEDIQMHSFQNGTSLAAKLSNWSQLGKFFAKRNLKPIRELIDGTIHCKPGAAEIFVQDIYTMLTNRRIKHIQDEEIDFSDHLYQNRLPMVARSTASTAIKANIKLTEIMVEPNINKNRQKVNAIINLHLQRRQLEREQYPGGSAEIRGKTGVHFKTIEVKQAERCPFDVNLNEDTYVKGLPRRSEDMIS